LIKDELAGKTACTLSIGVGQPQSRIGDIHQSFSQALAAIERGTPGNGSSDQIAAKTELLKLNKSAVVDYLRCGVVEEFDTFFAMYIHPLSQAAVDSYIIKNYIFVDIVLTTAKFVGELGGSIDHVVPEINQIETVLLNIKTVEQFKEQTRKILIGTLEFRDQQAGNQYVEIIHQAKAYVDQHYANPDLSLNEVAAHINLSPSHFSMVFSRETGETFKEYLTTLKIQKAKELLRTTSLKSFEISYRVGYKDPHYFSHVFKKQTGLSPKEFRLQGQVE
jgi:two-component system response regulator YesN